ncbi:MAG: hypothetical protein O3B42_08720, partial [Actinomycetota bacterium]|nr:hypothetical protein [Actinomycetota bacterium]
SILAVLPLFGVAAADTERAADASVAPWWVLIIVGIGLAVLIGSFVWKGNKHLADRPVDPADWKAHARSGYIDGRWLYDSMGEDLAVWLGNGLVETSPDSLNQARTHAATWEAVPGRLDAARDSLYALEATAPDLRSAEAAREAVSALLEVRSEVDVRAESRAAYRSAAAQPEPLPASLIEARDSEVRASSQFSVARSRLAEALAALSALI